ncbi:MAG: RimK family protein [Myxococcota bacterium]
MPSLIVVEKPSLWSLDVPGAETVSARAYLTERRFVDMRRTRVFNLCRSYAYQTVGYYVSLLALARGHRPMPSVTTLQDLRQASLVRIASSDFDGLMQKTLAPIKSDRFVLSIYFGRNLAKRYDRLSKVLFDHFPVPLLRAEFARGDRWRLQRLDPIASRDIPKPHEEFVIEQAQRFFARPRAAEPKRARYELAILCNPNEVDSPSNQGAIKRFVRAAGKVGLRAQVIGKDHFGRIGEYDALLIRETTAVNHHTYRFARRAEAEGLVVIDDPDSIVRCTNKVYQAELFAKLQIPCPQTMVVHRDNVGDIVPNLGLPVVLKRPDSSFSAGVVKADNQAELRARLNQFFEQSELVVAQKYVPSEFDWRVGVLDGQALYVCRYHMAKGHWQIQKSEGVTARRYGKVETLRVNEAPERVLELGTQVASAVGHGLYGVDIKEVEGEFLVMEINDNPNIDAGYEDLVLKDELYMAVMRYFLNRLDQRVRGEGVK